MKRCTRCYGTGFDLIVREGAYRRVPCPICQGGEDVRHVDKSPDYVQGFEDGKRAGRLEARAAIDEAEKKASDDAHLAIGQCPSCYAINRHEPNCTRKKL